jgi:Lon protease-like protein
MMYLPMFPLNLVAFPHEQLNLHIFEPRYKQLINDCLAANSTFGIPTYIDKQLMPYGTEMMISKVVKTYDNGELDISTVGVRIFKLENFENPMDGKLYAGGEISFVNHEELSEVVDNELFELVEEFYTYLKKRVDYSVTIPQPFSYRIAHKIGLSIKEEYELLQIPTERLRQAFLKKHFKKIIPIVSELERTKEKIALNGHFKNLDPLDF